MTKFDVLSQFAKHRTDHKSSVFLYPILQFPDNVVKPLNTHLYLNEVQDYKDRYLFVLFHENQKGYNQKIIEQHDLWDFCLTTEDGYHIHVFTFEKHFKYFDQILIGDYEGVDLTYKLILGKENHPVVAIALNPSDFHESYAVEFKIDVQQLPKGAQLVSKPDIKQEILIVGRALMKKFNEFRTGKK